ARQARRRRRGRQADAGGGRGQEPRRNRRCARGREGARRRVKVLALDYGSARTGIAVSDPTGTLARPLGVVERAGGESGLAELARLVREEEGERVVVGLPLTLRGARGERAAESERCGARPRRTVGLPAE